MSAHAKLSASSSHRWIACPGSIKAESGMPNTTSIHADTGTAAHELAELCLTQGLNPFDFEGQPLPSGTAITVDREMCGAVSLYIDYVKSHKGELFVEQRVDFGHVVPDGFGTSDAIVIEGDTLTVIDLKYGKGVRVDAEENTQAILYAIGAMAEHSYIEIKHIKVAIVQPRLDHISEWLLPVEEVAEWAKLIRQAAQEALSDEAKRTPGEKQCQWCKAKATCPALCDLTRDTLLGDFEGQPNPDTLSDKQLCVALENKKLIGAWLEAVESLVVERLNAGKVFEGFKLVEGRANRAWSDETEVSVVLKAELGDEAYTPPKLITPAAAEKLLGKKRLELIADFISKPQGAPTLAPESDKRPAINVDANCFDEQLNLC